MNDQHAPVDWRDGTVPVSRRFDDPYYSLAGGLDETRHVFLAGNDLPGRFAPGLRIAEAGFGTGLNFLVTLAAWRAAGAPAPLLFTSFEAYPMAPADMARALAAFPQLSGLTAQMVGALDRGPGPYEFGGATLRLVTGDVRATLPGWTGMADAWFLDGFSPAKNPQMWGAALMSEVARHTAPGGTAATYTAAGHVRRSLAEAGFDVARAPGYGRKRHMTRARLPA